MRQRRRGRRRTAPVELIGPRLASGEEAVAALRVSAADDSCASIVVLICDRELRIMLATAFEGAPAAGVATAVELVLTAVPPESALVVGILRGEQGDAALDRLELEAIDEAARACARADVALADVLVLGGRSGSVERVAGTGYGVDNGGQ